MAHVSVVRAGPGRMSVGAETCEGLWPYVQMEQWVQQKPWEEHTLEWWDLGEQGAVT